MTLYLLQYNNYFNRTLKREDDLSDYMSYVQQTITGVYNFDPGDGVSATQIVNVSYVLANTPDYLLAVEDSSTFTRWFIIESENIRGGQVRLRLRRDVIADSWSYVKSAPMYLYKGILSNVDVNIFNKEDFSANKIKQSNTYLTDETGVSWIVGYMPMASESEESTSVRGYSGVTNADQTYASWAAWPLHDYALITGGSQTEPASRCISTLADNDLTLIANIYNANQTATMGIRFEYSATIGSCGYQDENNPEWTCRFDGAEDLLSDEPPTAAIQAYHNYSGRYFTTDLKNKLITPTATNTAIRNLNGKVIQIGDTKYSVSVASAIKYYNGTLDNFIADAEKRTDITAITNSLVSSTGEFMEYNPLSDQVSHQDINLTINTYSYIYMTLREVFANVFYCGMTKNRLNLYDQPYSMFCMPYKSPTGTNTFSYYDTTGTLQSVDMSFYSQSMAAGMSMKYGGDSPSLYDLQVVPYCPLRDVFTNGHVDLRKMTAHEGYEQFYLTDSTKISGFMFWSKYSTFSFDIVNAITVSDNKLFNETETYRLMSPNAGDIYEFSPAKNGNVQAFNVDCTYKPYNPYIHVCPNFGYLYGIDNDDARGLICTGDFSFPQTTDAWATYQRQNVNYQNMFNRQVESQEVQNKYANKAAVASTVSSALTTGATTAMAGGAAVGLAAGAASLLAGGADVKYQKILQKEQISLMKDQFAMNLETIQALPAGLQNVGAITANFKYVPYLEHYSCSDTEKTALKQKIKYNGMTINRIGKIADIQYNTYDGNTENWTQGQLIKLFDITEDAHYTQEVANELAAGLFIPNSTDY